LNPGRDAGQLGYLANLKSREARHGQGWQGR
jgi:hypothetical protein